MTLLAAPADRGVAPAASPGVDTSQPPELVRRRKALLRFAISITVLNVVGHLILGFEQAPIVPIVAVVASYAVNLAMEWADARVHGRVPQFAGSRTDAFYFLLPAHIAALACSMLLYADNLGPYLFAVTAAAASKYLFRVRVGAGVRHYLNPSNFGIAVTLLTMPLVGFAPPYMFLNNIDQPWDWLLPAGVLMAGTLLNSKLTRKMPLILGWVGGYVLQALVRTVLFGDSFVATIGMMTGVAFVLYTNYMITDPATTPTAPRRQLLFGLSTAAMYGLLVSAGISYAIFFALITVCAVRGLTLRLARRGPVAIPVPAAPAPVPPAVPLGAR